MRLTGSGQAFGGGTAINHEDTDNRIELSQALWDLRCGIARRGGASANQVSFGRMLTDPGYRARVIGRVRQSESEELRRLGDAAAQLNTGRLAESPVSWDAAGRTELDIDELADDGQRQARQIARNVPIAGAAMVVMLFAIAGGVMSYLFSDSLAAMIAGRKHVGGEITESTTWRSGRTYVLDDMVYVTDGATLTIERGARVLGESGSALVITRSANIQAHGTRTEPIVFTSSRPPGERARGDWGGLVLLGDSPVNDADPHVEGIPGGDPRGDFGGADAAGSCGVLKYSRIEFAGHEIAANIELNGLTLGGCGNATVVRHVQVHMGLDDGIEIFGGSVNLDHIVLTREKDDSLDWDRGWRGNAQFVVIQQEADAGDNGFEADNNVADHDAQPRSEPTIANVTMVGSRSKGASQRAMTLRRGTAGDLRNIIVTGFPAELVDLRDRGTAAMVAAGRLRFSGVIADRIGPGGDRYEEPENGERDDDGGFDEAGFLRSSAVRLGTDPGLPEAAFDLRAPRFVPAAGSPAAHGAAELPQGEFWDEGARYIGALEPGATSSWLDGWTAFPAD